MTSDTPDRPSAILLGTSAFTAAGWLGSFYPAGLPPRDFLAYYATKFDTVEVDSTFYRCPSRTTVRNWYSKTPKHFIFAAKVPQEITHDRMLLNCKPQCSEFFSTIELLGEKLGPLLLQFRYFNRSEFSQTDEFLARLIPFLEQLPTSHTFALEIRNKFWLTPRFADVLRKYGVALVLQDQSWMPRPREIFQKFDPITADFAYIRWLGDRRGIERVTKTWDKTVWDRTRELSEWTELIRHVQERRIKIFGYVNNHFAGHAPATVALLRKALGLRSPLASDLRLPFGAEVQS